MYAMVFCKWLRDLKVEFCISLYSFNFIKFTKIIHEKHRHKIHRRDFFSIYRFGYVNREEKCLNEDGCIKHTLKLNLFF